MNLIFVAIRLEKTDHELTNLLIVMSDGDPCKGFSSRVQW